MELDDIIQAVAAATFTARVTETLSVIRETGHAIGNGAEEIRSELTTASLRLDRRCAATGSGE
jgi:hypothetical protein